VAKLRLAKGFHAAGA